MNVVNQLSTPPRPTPVPASTRPGEEQVSFRCVWLSEIKRTFVLSNELIKDFVQKMILIRSFHGSSLWVA
jgi:hypothetical protein